MRFIELHEYRNGEMILININNIISISTDTETPACTDIHTLDDILSVKESIDEIKRKIYG